MVATSCEVAYTALRTTIEALSGPACVFPPLGIAIEGVYKIVTILDVRPIGVEGHFRLLT